MHLLELSSLGLGTVSYPLTNMLSEGLSSKAGLVLCLDSAPLILSIALKIGVVVIKVSYSVHRDSLQELMIPLKNSRIIRTQCTC